MKKMTANENRLQLCGPKKVGDNVGPKIRMFISNLWNRVQHNFEQGERIHVQIQARKEETILLQLKSGIYPRMF